MCSIQRAGKVIEPLVPQFVQPACPSPAGAEYSRTRPSLSDEDLTGAFRSDAAVGTIIFVDGNFTAVPHTEG